MRTHTYEYGANAVNAVYVMYVMYVMYVINAAYVCNGPIVVRPYGEAGGTVSTVP